MFVFELRIIAGLSFRAISLVGLLVLAANGALAQNTDNAAPAPASGTSASTTTNPGQAPPANIPSYPNTAKGLANLVKEMLKLEKEGNQQELAQYVRSLALPDPDNWFKSVFGDESGAQVAAVSMSMHRDIETSIPKILAAQEKEKRTGVEAVRFTESCNVDETDDEYPFLLLRQRPEPLYDVRFVGGTDMMLWKYFAYVDGGFRFIGNLQRANVKMPPPQPQPASAPRIRIGGNVSAARLVHREDPVYPSEAKLAGIQGTVILHAIIAKDGSIRDLELVEGQCLLVQSAMDAVKKWRYSPTLLESKPVEVDTTIQVIFTLGR